MLSFCADDRCSWVGTAAVGTAPGSVKDVFTWEAKANAAKILYAMAAVGGIPPVTAKKVMVKALYSNRTHTKKAMMVPAVSA